jgi:hypothetical protein
MGQKKVKKLTPIKEFNIPTEPTTNLEKNVGGSTLIPTIGNRNKSIIDYDMESATTAPKIGEPSQHNEKYAESPAGLVDKYLLSKGNISTILVFVAIVAIFVWDNYSGKLSTFQGIGWSFFKSLPIILLMIIVSCVDRILNKRN